MKYLAEPSHWTWVPQSLRSSTYGIGFAEYLNANWTINVHGCHFGLKVRAEGHSYYAENSTQEELENIVSLFDPEPLTATVSASLLSDTFKEWEAEAPRSERLELFLEDHSWAKQGNMLRTRMGNQDVFFECLDKASITGRLWSNTSSTATLPLNTVFPSRGRLEPGGGYKLAQWAEQFLSPLEASVFKGYFLDQLHLVASS